VSLELIQKAIGRGCYYTAINLTQATEQMDLESLASLIEDVDNLADELKGSSRRCKQIERRRKQLFTLKDALFHRLFQLYPNRIKHYYDPETSRRAKKTLHMVYICQNRQRRPLRHCRPEIAITKP